MLTPQQVAVLFDYDPESGVVSHKTGAGKFYRHGRGYLFTTIARRNYYAHRLGWAVAHGKWPTGHIDHFNGQTDDNRLANLRDVTHSENLQNRSGASAANRCGLLGVSLHGKRWRATISVKGRPRWHIGSFDTPEEAHAAYVAAKVEMHPSARSL